MKLRTVTLSLLTLCLTLAALPAMAQMDLYDNGPVNGQVDAWTINSGFSVSDTIHCCGAPGVPAATVTGISFGAWLEPGDTATSVEVAIGTTGFFSNNVFDGTVTLTSSNCFSNTFGLNVCTESGDFSGPILTGGNYFLTLENATTAEGNPLYWDENSGVGCGGDGMPGSCPSLAQENTLGTIPSESFTLFGNGSTTTTTTSGSTPEPSSVMLFGSGLLGLTGVLRRKAKR